MDPVGLFDIGVQDVEHLSPSGCEVVPLFHGPAAREVALEWAEKKGRLLAPPLGDGGLKVSTSREVVELLGSVPVGDQVGTLVVGPMDSATPEAVDALLKTLEEISSEVILPALWAEDVSEVVPTIKSRTTEHWCPPDPEATPEAPYLSTAESLCEASLRRRTASVIEILQENQGSELALLRASVTVLASKSDWKLSVRLKLWESIRSTLQHETVTRQMSLAAFLV